MSDWLDSKRQEFQRLTWIKIIPFNEADEKLRRAIEAQLELYPEVPVNWRNYCLLKAPQLLLENNAFTGR